MSSIQEHFRWPTCTFFLYTGKDSPSCECKVYSFLGSVTAKKGEIFDIYRRIIRTIDGAQQTLRADIETQAEDHKMRLYYDPECKLPANITVSFNWGISKLPHSRSKSDTSIDSL